MLHMKCISKCAIPKRVAFDSEWAAYQLRRDVVFRNKSHSFNLLSLFETSSSITGEFIINYGGSVIDYTR